MTKLIKMIKKFFSKFRINKRLVSKAKRDCIILHCLPRGEEITDQVFQATIKSMAASNE